MNAAVTAIFRLDAAAAGGPLYLRLRRAIEDALRAGLLAPGDALPSERDIAAIADISRVTVRKAVQALVREGVLVQRHGSGTFVAHRIERVEQSLSHLTSFSEDMARRGMAVRAVWLERGIFPPAPEETIALGLSADEKVARIARLRVANDTPLAIERASLAQSVLPDPETLTASLYERLEAGGHRPVRAIQRISAITLGAREADLLQTRPGAASLRIERTSYLASGRAVEFTRSVYRGDAYDFVAELRLDGSAERQGA